MTPLPASAKSMGASVPVFLVLTLLCWLYMLRTIALWIGRTPVPGRETDRIMMQVTTAIAALLLWIFLAALLLIASSKHVLPREIGILAWFVHPLSGAAALLAIAVMYDPQLHWPAAIPAIAPIAIGGYVLYAFFPQAQTIPLAKAGFAMCGVVLALSLAIVPEVVHFLHTAAENDGSIDATPGPKLDAWMAKQREKRRKEELEELRKSDDETKLYELEHLVRPDSPVLKEALEFMRHLPNRQADATLQLQGQSSFILHFLGDIDLKATPELCTAARGYLRRAVRERTTGFNSGPSTFIGAEFTEGLNSIRWISKNCGCDAELAQIEAYARAQQQDSPEVRKFLADLVEIKDQRLAR